SGHFEFKSLGDGTWRRLLSQYSVREQRDGQSQRNDRDGLLHILHLPCSTFAILHFDAAEAAKEMRRPEGKLLRIVKLSVRRRSLPVRPSVRRGPGADSGCGGLYR